MSRYKRINGYDWLAMPAGAYLYAVDLDDEVPATASVAEVDGLRADYRANHPDSFVADPPEYGWSRFRGICC